MQRGEKDGRKLTHRCGIAAAKHHASVGAGIARPDMLQIWKRLRQGQALALQSAPDRRGNGRLFEMRQEINAIFCLKEVQG